MVLVGSDILTNTKEVVIYIGRPVPKPRVSMGANPDFKDLDSRPLWCVFSSN